MALDLTTRTTMIYYNVTLYDHPGTPFVCSHVRVYG
eukprot:COSAG05_NODE_18441_length_308_cov_0.990431_1_plen_35_part_01